MVPRKSLAHPQVEDDTHLQANLPSELQGQMDAYYQMVQAHVDGLVSRENLDRWVEVHLNPQLQYLHEKNTKILLAEKKEADAAARTESSTNYHERQHPDVILRPYMSSFLRWHGSEDSMTDITRQTRDRKGSATELMTTYGDKCIPPLLRRKWEFVQSLLSPTGKRHHLLKGYRNRTGVPEGSPVFMYLRVDDQDRAPFSDPPICSLDALIGEKIKKTSLTGVGSPTFELADVSVSTPEPGAAQEKSETGAAQEKSETGAD